MDNTNTANGHGAPEPTSVMGTMPSDRAQSMEKQLVGHGLAMDDPDNPMNWPLWRKVFASAAGFACAFVVAFGATSFATSIDQVESRFGVSPVYAVFGFSIIFLGIASAPLHTPHISERLGRKPVYLASLPLFAICIIGVGFQKTFGGVMALRFLAGVFGGPCLVLIEGTFADVWSSRTTVTYYSALTLGSYLGAAFGPFIMGFIVPATAWTWNSWVTVFLTIVAWLLALGAPETFGRQILRNRAHREGRPHHLPPPQSGVTLAEMASHTVINPLKMLVTEPIVVLIALYLGLSFAVVFQWFITVPATLMMVYNFSLQRAGLAFLAAVGGALLAAFTSTTLELTMGVRMLSRTTHAVMAPVERRMFPAMVGSFGVFAALFWIGFTASPTVSFYSPIFGTALYVWGNMSILVSFVSYLFDAYPPQGTLSALTAAAVFRLICAGTVPVGILPMVMNLSGAWAFGTFGFISLAMIPIPYIIFFFGARLRARSLSSKGGMSTVEAEMKARHEGEGVAA